MGYRDLLENNNHRPWPLPASPWVMVQQWHNLLFAHWPIPSEVVRPLIPACFELDIFEGRAWLGVVPFRMSDVRLRYLPRVPFTHKFPELNVRTYVIHRGKRGVFFFSLDAASTIAVWTARFWFNLPYFQAHMSLVEQEDIIHYDSRRTHPNVAEALFVGHYKPISEVYRAQPESLEQWLTERYCLYTVDRNGHPYRGEIHHLPWPLQQAEASLKQNSMAAASGIQLPRDAPLLHYAHQLTVLIWPLRRLVG